MLTKSKIDDLEKFYELSILLTKKSLMSNTIFVIEFGLNRGMWNECFFFSYLLLVTFTNFENYSSTILRLVRGENK